MFEFFKKRFKSDNRPEIIAKGATIEPVLMAGDIGGFLIYLNVDHATALANLNSQAAQSSFVTIIESRITAYEFEDERLLPAGITPLKRKILASAKRAVLVEGKPFVSW